MSFSFDRRGFNMSWEDFDGETMPFGKYAGEHLAWVVENDRRYARWCLAHFDDDAIVIALENLLEEH
jgi:hypothetical protein